MVERQETVDVKLCSWTLRIVSMICSTTSSFFFTFSSSSSAFDFKMEISFVVLSSFLLVFSSCERRFYKPFKAFLVSVDPDEVNLLEVEHARFQVVCPTVTAAGQDCLISRYLCDID